MALLSAWLASVSEWMRGVLAFPAVIAMLTLVGDVLLESVRHHLALDLQRRDQSFSLAFATRAAEITFERHLAFCDEYVGLVLAAFRDLQAHGTPAAVTGRYADKLRAIRDKYGVVLTSQVEDQLVDVEKLLRAVEAGEETFRALPVGKDRTAIVRETHEALKALVGTPNPGRSNDSALHGVLSALRELLGVEQLTRLRVHAVRTFASQCDEPAGS